MDKIKSDILMHGVDDWVYMSEVVDIVRQVAGKLDEAATSELAVRAVSELLRAGLVEVGDVTDTGFVRWPGTVEDNIRRIEQSAAQQVLPLRPGDIFWMNNTPLGDERGRALLEARRN